MEVRERCLVVSVAIQTVLDSNQRFEDQRVRLPGRSVPHLVACSTFAGLEADGIELLLHWPCQLLRHF